jgi:3-deoxy-7-phosphoheptulonate synthase
MRHDATPEDIQGVVNTMEEMGYEARPMPGKQRTAIGWWGTTARSTRTGWSRSRGDGGDPRLAAVQAGVARVAGGDHRHHAGQRHPHRRQRGGGDGRARAPWRARRRSWTSRAGSAPRGPPSCARAPSSRAPRRTPSRGLGEPGLRLLDRAREETGMAIVTEAVDPRAWSWWPSTRTSSRSARATCRTSPCCAAPAAAASPSC